MINYTKKNCKKCTRNILNLSEEVKDKRRKKARERHQNFGEEENKKGNKNLSEEQMKELAGYRRDYYLTPSMNT